MRLKQPFGSTIFSRTKDLIPALLTYSYTTPCSRWVLSTVKLMRGVSSPVISGEMMVCCIWAGNKIKSKEVFGSTMNTGMHGEEKSGEGYLMQRLKDTTVGSRSV